ncbi:MAG: ESX secretion-associated protein EspG [Actinomycetota bacterium]|nr:ESX secretion-associated protein EspG [Actinomycetota bacterium]
MLAHPAQIGVEHREFEALERIGGWERVIAWAQARQIREIASFMHSAQVRNAAVGASTSQAYDSAVAEVGLMLRVSARTTAARVSDAWSLITRLRGALAAVEHGRITLAKARILDAETLNLSDEHAAQVEEQVLGKARQQTPGQLRAAIRRAVLVADPQAAKEWGEQARRQRGVQMWSESDGICARGEHAVVAELGEGGLILQTVRSTALPTAMAQLIPDHPAGSGTAVSVPADLLPEQEGLTGPEVERALLCGGVRGEDARRFRAMLQGPKLGGGKFGAVRYDRRGAGTLQSSWSSTTRPLAVGTPSKNAASTVAASSPWLLRHAPNSRSALQTCFTPSGCNDCHPPSHGATWTAKPSPTWRPPLRSEYAVCWPYRRFAGCGVSRRLPRSPSGNLCWPFRPWLPT